MSDVERRLLIHCGGYASRRRLRCRQVVSLPTPFSLDDLPEALRGLGWFVALASSPGVQPVLFDPLCGRCARAILPREVIDAATRLLGADA